MQLIISSSYICGIIKSVQAISIHQLQILILKGQLSKLCKDSLNQCPRQLIDLDVSNFQYLLRFFQCSKQQIFYIQRSPRPNWLAAEDISKASRNSLKVMRPFSRRLVFVQFGTYLVHSVVLFFVDRGLVILTCCHFSNYKLRLEMFSISNYILYSHFFHNIVFQIVIRSQSWDGMPFLFLFSVRLVLKVRVWTLATRNSKDLSFRLVAANDLA